MLVIEYYAQVLKHQKLTINKQTKRPLHEHNKPD